LPPVARVSMPGVASAEPAPRFAPASASVPASPAPAAEKKTESPPEPPAAAEKAAESFQAPPVPAGRQVRRHWEEFIDYVKERKRWMAHVLRLCASARDEGSDLVLKFDDPSDCKVLEEHDNLKLLTEFAQDFFQHAFRIVFHVRGSRSDGEAGEEGESPSEERRALANDPLVQMASEIFGGQVGSIRTGPRSR